MPLHLLYFSGESGPAINSPHPLRLSHNPPPRFLNHSYLVATGGPGKPLGRECQTVWERRRCQKQCLVQSCTYGGEFRTLTVRGRIRRLITPRPRVYGKAPWSYKTISTKKEVSIYLTPGGKHATNLHTSSQKLLPVVISNWSLRCTTWALVL